MFCPNCGTSNEDTAPRCKQCGFELQQAKPAAPKFKGTMLLGQSPFADQKAGAAPGAATPAGGTSGAPRPEAARAALKGTMVGVAPPAVGSAAPPAAGTATPGPAAPAGGAVQQRPAFKGTMIGIAPPTVGAPGAAAPPPGATPPPAAAAPSATPAGTQISSKLKGTMIGVAPPSIGSEAPPAQPAAPAGSQLGMDATVAIPSQAPQVPPAGGGLPRTEAMPAVGRKDSVNPLGGTVLGASAPDFSAPPAPATPAATAFEKTALGHPPVALPPEQPAAPAPEAGPGAGSHGLDAFGTTAPADPTGGSAAAQLAAAAPAPAQQITPSYAQPLAPSGARGPIGKVRNPVATFLLAMLCFVYGLIAYIQMLGELKRFRQKNDLSIILFFIPIISIIEVLKLPEKVADAQRMAGIANPQVAHPVLYLFFGVYFLPADLNEVWEAARRSGG